MSITGWFTSICPCLILRFPRARNTAEMSPEAHGDVQERTQPGAATTTSVSLHKKEFESETDGGKHREFTGMEVHTREARTGKLRD